MKYKTDELLGARLDQAVAKACGYIYDKHLRDDFIVTTIDPSMPARPPELVSREVCRAVVDGHARSFCPSSEWSHGGPIMEQEGISPERHKPDSMDAGDPLVSDGRWIWVTDTGCGPTMLSAAMREVVRRKFGDTVDL